MLVSLEHVTRYNQSRCILDDVSMVIEDKDKIGIVGINGMGKSTLLKIIAGIYDFEGNMITRKDLKISYLPQNNDFNDDCTVIEEVYKHIKEEVPDYEVKAILNRFNITQHNQSMKELSGGQKKRVALSIALLDPGDLLILDEPTNHLDSEMIEYLEKYLIKRSKAILMVTHDRYFLERVVNKIIEIDRSKLYSYEANFSKYLEQKQIREEEMLNQQRKRKQFLKKELEWVRAGVQARSTKPKDRLKRFEELSNIKDIETINNVEMINLSTRLGKKTIEFHNISKSYNDKVLFKNFSYLIKRYERIGILGPNGCGKSTLLNIIARMTDSDEGYIDYGDTIKIGYFRQGNDDIDENLMVIDYIKETSTSLLTEKGLLSAKTMCERFLFNDELQHTYISQLSGGEKRRLYLLKILMSAPNVLLLDEPTNDLDITTLAILEDYLDDFKGIVIAVSHDRYFLDKVCDSLLIFNDTEIQYHTGSYSTIKYEKKKEAKVKKDTRVRKVTKLSYKESKELETLEESIPLLEKEIKEIEEKMNTNDFDVLQELMNKRDELNDQLEIDSLRYIELLEKQEQLMS